MGTGTSNEAKLKKKLASINEPAHVIVVGAGLAGLSAAYELEREGFRCTVLEAERKHIGGRVRTYRFDDGQYGELGAMRIPEVHKTVFHYIEKFNLKTRPFVNSNPNGYFYIRGRRERRSNLAKIAKLFQLRPWENGQSPDDIWVAVVKEIADALTEDERKDLLGSARWKSKKLYDLDQFSLHQVFERAGVSPEAIEYVGNVGGYGETLFGPGFIEYLREEVEETWLNDFHEIEGGMDRLPEAFANAINGDVMKGCKVIGLRQDANRNRIKAIYRKDGKEKKITGDYLVCTLPFSVMQDVVVKPSLSAGKQRAIRQMIYESAGKVLLHAKRRFWEDDDKIIGGQSNTDMLIGPMFYPSDNAQAKSDEVARGPGVMIASYNWGEAARRIGALSPDDRVALAKKQVARVHPQVKKDKTLIDCGVSMAWGEYEFSRGAFSFYDPGQFSRLHNDVVSVEGRIHFAGEHTSLTHTWMEGALVSGRRVAAEIAKRHQEGG